MRYLFWRFYWWTLSSKINRLDGIVFLENCSSSTRFDDLKKAKKLKVKKFFIPNSFSALANFKLKKQPKKFLKRSQIIAVGAYNWQKGFDFVLKAYSKSKAKNKVIIKFFGFEETRYIIHLEKLRKKLKISQNYVKFCVGFKEEELLDEYENSKILLFGSYSECQPLSLVNACVTGTPFIARNSGAITNMPGGKVVFTVNEMSFQINQILYDEIQWNNLSTNGRKFGIKKYSIKKNTNKLSELINEI